MVDTFLAFLRTDYSPNDCKAASLSPAEMAQYRLAYGDDKAPVDAPTYNNNGPVTQSQPTYVQLKLKLKPSEKHKQTHGSATDSESDPEDRQRKKVCNKKSSRHDNPQHICPHAVKVLTPSSSKRYSSKRPSEIQISKGRWVALAASKIGPPRGAKCAAASSSEINEPAPKCQGPILSPSSSPPMSTINACLDPPSASPHEPIASTSESPLDLPVHNLPSHSKSPIHGNAPACKSKNPLELTTVAPLASDPGWPSWLSASYKFLSQNSKTLGTPWLHLLESFTWFKSSSDMARDKACSMASWPPQVGLWIQNARQRVSAIPDLQIFDAQWWAWWRAQQPSWRTFSGTAGPISADELLPLPTENLSNTLLVLDCPGRNGVLSVISSLKWWGDELQSLMPQDPNWLDTEAVKSWKIGVADINCALVLLWLEKGGVEMCHIYLPKVTSDMHSSTIIA
ncbi:hypothetical protein BDN71DRAFT_1513389 [Pleurotus eryngii]|uniref:Uncharacterized protein n=1 Tax=Pleurotus eryngii TaxID=5323 RepID=A0A9P5ZHC3_PLEER|nr:hypothetical protein BDN71DRAFT_1513389 [Pleurotus eryngii]